MKILAFTDTHGKTENLSAIKNLVEKTKPDILVCAGDFTNFGKKINQQLSKFDFNIDLIFIPGNHEEGKKINNPNKKFSNIHKTTKEFNGVLFVGCGGGIYGDIELNLEECKNKLEKEIKLFRSKSDNGKVIFVTHRPPKNTKLDYMKKISKHVGAKNISEFIKKNSIDISISGHIHETARKIDKLNKTKLYNPGPKGRLIRV